MVQRGERAEGDLWTGSGSLGQAGIKGGECGLRVWCEMVRGRDRRSGGGVGLAGVTLRAATVVLPANSAGEVRESGGMRFLETTGGTLPICLRKYFDKGSSTLIKVQA